MIDGVWEWIKENFKDEEGVNIDNEYKIIVKKEGMTERVIDREGNKIYVCVPLTRVMLRDFEKDDSISGSWEIIESVIKGIPEIEFARAIVEIDIQEVSIKRDEEYIDGAHIIACFEIEDKMGYDSWVRFLWELGDEIGVWLLNTMMREEMRQYFWEAVQILEDLVDGF